MDAKSRFSYDEAQLFFIALFRMTEMKFETAPNSLYKYEQLISFRDFHEMKSR